MVALLWILSAFEFSGLAGPSSAMLAGTAVPDWIHSFTFNPALALNPCRVRAAVEYTRPYGLAGLNWGRACAGWSSERLAAGTGLSVLSLDRYSEYDAQAVLSAMPVRDVSVGLAVHALVIDAGRSGQDFAPAVDCGACWALGRFRVAGSGLRLNAPRWHDGIDQPAKLVLAGSWRPVDEVLVALDLSREGPDEDAAFGCDLSLVPQLGLRFGVGASPLRFGAGLGANVGPIGFEYAYQFHPALKESHVFGLRAAWH